MFENCKILHLFTAHAHITQSTHGALFVNRLFKHAQQKQNNLRQAPDAGSPSSGPLFRARCWSSRAEDPRSAEQHTRRGPAARRRCALLISLRDGETAQTRPGERRSRSRSRSGQPPLRALASLRSPRAESEDASVAPHRPFNPDKYMTASTFIFLIS